MGIRRLPVAPTFMRSPSRPGGLRCRRSNAMDASARPGFLDPVAEGSSVLRRLLVALLILAAVELAILVCIARLTSIATVLLLVLASGVAGSLLARYEGLRVWRRVHQQIQRGDPPADSLLEGLLVLVAGALLVLPGVLSDVAGILLLFPPIRRIVAHQLQLWIGRRLFMVGPQASWQPPGDPDSDRDRIIDVRVIDPASKKIEDQREEGR